MDRNIIKNIGKFLIFAVLIVLPFICFSWLMHTFTEDGDTLDELVSIFARLANIAFLPGEIIIVISLNQAGFNILKKDNVWRKFAFLWLFLQALVSAFIAAGFFITEIGMVCTSIFDFLGSIHYWYNSMILMSICNIFSFAAIVNAEKKNSRPDHVNCLRRESYMADPLLGNFTKAAVYLRSNIENPENLQVVAILTEAFRHNISNNEMCDKLKALNVPYVYALEYDTGEALSEEDEVKCGFILKSLLYLQELLTEKQFEKAYDIVDILHVFPDVRLNEKKSSKAFWKCFVCPFEKKYHDRFFEELKSNNIR